MNVTDAQVESFRRDHAEESQFGEIPFRKAYLGSILDPAEVDDRQIRIVGRNDIIEPKVIGNPLPTQMARHSE
jgi:hypothetical protein